MTKPSSVTRVTKVNKMLDEKTTRLFERVKLADDMVSAIEFNQTKKIKTIMSDKYFDVNTYSKKYNMSPIVYACSKGNAKVVRMLLTCDGININYYDDYSSTLLYDACKGGHIEVVKELLTYPNIDVNAGKCNCLPIHAAAGSNSVEIIKLLIAEPQFQVSAGFGDQETTPLMHAARKGQTQAVEFLLFYYPLSYITKTCFNKSASDIARREYEDDIADLIDTHIANQTQSTQPASPV